MSRRLPATILLLALAAAAAAQTRPNVLFLLSDDHRADAIAAYGNPHVRTPHLDALARRGFSFRAAYCMGSIHGAVCQPSRAMLLSGRTLHHVRMDLRGVTTLPEAMAAAGYATFATGKWHNGAKSLLRGFAAGHAIMLGGMSDHTRVPVRDLVEPGRLGPKRTGDRFSSELFADAAIDFLEGRDPTRPFFLYVAFTAPHDPRQPPREFVAPYYADRPPLPPNFLPQHPFDNGWTTGRDEQLAPWPRPPEIVRDQIAEYYGMITHLDAQIGRILATLERLGLVENTIVVYASDHGLALGSHGLLGKQNLYEHSTRAPLILAGPGVPRGASPALVYLLDVFPTLCGLTGVRVPSGVDGRDLGSLLRGERRRVRHTLFTLYEDKMRAVRDERFKLIRYPPIDRTQLFDLVADPFEMRDLSADPAHRKTLARLSLALRGWHALADDPAPLEVADPRPDTLDLTGRPRKPDRWQPRWIRKKYFGK